MFPCPVCGCLTLQKTPGGTFACCDVCCFEDVWYDWGTIKAAQRTFYEVGAVDPELVELSRGPLPHEAPPTWWATLHVQRQTILAQLRPAFADTTLEGGVDYLEADKIDDYELPSRDLNSAPPRGYGSSPPWHEVSWPEQVSNPGFGSFCFMDARGLRFYAPISLAHLLGANATEGDEGTFVFMLTQHHRLATLHELLTPAQRTVVASYLALLASEPGGMDGQAVRRALQSTWGASLDPAHLAWLLALGPM